MESVFKHWNKKLSGNDRDFYLWEDNEFALTVDDVNRFMELYAESKRRGCHFNIITPCYSIIDGWLHMGRPMEPYWTKLKQHKPKTQKQREMMRQSVKNALKRMFEMEDYMEGWRRRMRRLSL